MTFSRQHCLPNQLRQNIRNFPVKVKQWKLVVLQWGVLSGKIQRIQASRYLTLTLQRLILMQCKKSSCNQRYFLKSKASSHVNSHQCHWWNGLRHIYRGFFSGHMRKIFTGSGPCLMLKRSEHLSFFFTTLPIQIQWTPAILSESSHAMIT